MLQLDHAQYIYIYNIHLHTTHYTDAVTAISTPWQISRLAELIPEKVAIVLNSAWTNFKDDSKVCPSYVCISRVVDHLDRYELVLTLLKYIRR